MSAAIFDPDCKRCPRLVEYLAQSHAKYPDYHCAPVAPFGADQPRLLIVGLAPGMHGANRTGRPFTGDHAGGILYRTLYEHGFSSAPVSEGASDGLELRDARITNAVKCVPPANKPVGAEINNCRDFLSAELKSLARPVVVLALGGIAHRAVIRCLELRQVDFPFGHANEYEPEPGLTLIDSYHCSRYNTQTRRLTEPMFSAVFSRIREILDR
ncbi:MAG: uracil-DNA glycosylase [Gammaproteobacteria bacterium]|nr:uracil-DNA glycosylase [Gammaproteobacteria bacterium]NNF60462.1 uracil-DNA glycosylase [Gammaproteobacteria bacterium]